jgi:hypothetical protein
MNVLFKLNGLLFRHPVTAPELNENKHHLHLYQLGAKKIPKKPQKPFPPKNGDQIETKKDLKTPGIESEFHPR